MKLPLNIAEKLLLLVSGEKIPSSKLKHEIVKDMISEGIIHKPGKLKSTVQLADKQQLRLYLDNRFAIKDLHTLAITAPTRNWRFSG
jgi:ribosomal protein S8